MSTSNLQSAPFARGDRVLCRAEPRGVETIDRVDEIDGETFLRTVRSFEPLGRCIRVHAPAAEFEPARERRLSRRAAARLITVLCAVLWVAVVWASLAVLP